MLESLVIKKPTPFHPEPTIFLIIAWQTSINPISYAFFFDAAAKFSNTSLNQRLRKGPYLLNNLTGIFPRFRKGQCSITGNIGTMYHQLKVLKENTDSLRFLWHENFKSSIDKYIMCAYLR